MKKKFSAKWIASKQTRKQRKYRANAPLNVRAKMISANLSKALRQKYSKRSFRLRKGDEVKIMKGEFKGKKGKIASLDLDKLKVTIEAMQRTKKDGTKTEVVFDPSNLQIQEFNLDDKKRIALLSKKAKKSDVGGKDVSKKTKN